MKELEQIRSEINAIDQDILRLLEKRYAIAQEVTLAKKKTLSPTYHIHREQQLLSHLSASNPLKDDVRKVFNEIISLCRKNQEIFNIHTPSNELSQNQNAIKIIFGHFVQISPIESPTSNTDYLFVSLTDMSETTYDFITKQTHYRYGVVYHLQELKQDFLLLSNLMETKDFQDALCVNAPKDETIHTSYNVPKTSKSLFYILHAKADQGIRTYLARY